MNKQQKEQYLKEFNELNTYITKYEFKNEKERQYILKRIYKAAKMLVLKDTLLYRIKRFFIFLAGRIRQGGRQKNAM